MTLDTEKMFRMIAEANREYMPVLCIEGGRGFVKGKIYPVVGWNNGFHVFMKNESGDPVELLCHTYGDDFKPADEETYYPTFVECFDF